MLQLIIFFFSSRRRHTRWTGDWSSDVCSSDLPEGYGTQGSWPRSYCWLPPFLGDRRTRPRSEERRVGKSVDLGGRRIIKKKKKKKGTKQYRIEKKKTQKK